MTRAREPGRENAHNRGMSFFPENGWLYLMGATNLVLLAWLLSAIPFALLHLPTYQWDWVQCLAIIGTARLVLSLGYLLTRIMLVMVVAVLAINIFMAKSLFFN